MSDILTNKYQRVALSKITINREDRQRKVIDVEELVPSIRERGVLVPIIIDTDFNLIAGERRLTASRQLGLPDIPVRFAKDLSEKEKQLIELEENVKRQQLSWQETADALGKIHRMMSEDNEDWNVDSTAEFVGLSPRSVRRYIEVDDEIKQGTAGVQKATKLTEALTIVSRAKNRQLEAAINELTEKPKQEDAEQKTSNFMIEQKDTIAALENYTGPKFNFIHLDLPYGVKLGGQADKTQASTYDSDSPFDALLDALARNWHKIAAVDCHVMFWFSMKHY
ncbi:MAG: ParB/RepB/Spo0J family partition protein, partial [Casimicrobium sp.]